MIADFPFIWIPPEFIVPFAFAMHLFSIRQMIGWKAEGNGTFFLPLGKI